VRTRVCKAEIWIYTHAKRICPSGSRARKTNLTPGERSDLWREGRAPEEPAPQGAQQVNFVIGCSCPVAFCGAAMACIQMRHLKCQNAKWELCCSVCYTPWLCGAAQGKTSSRLNLKGVFAWPQSTTTAPRARDEGKNGR
jgi:hypothetical protein